MKSILLNRRRYLQTVSDKGLTYKIYKEFLQLNTKINKQPDYKMNRGPVDIILKKTYRQPSNT